MNDIFKNILRVVVPYSFRQWRFYHHVLKGKDREKRMAKLVDAIGKRNHVKVLFIACDLPMWRYQEVYELLRLDNRFTVNILIVPFRNRNIATAKRNSLELKSFFKRADIEAPSILDDGFDIDAWFDEFNPDLIFYCQQYPNFHNNVLDYENNWERLWGFIPYGIPTIRERFVYDTELHNLAWRVYFQTPLHLKSARKLMANGGRNVRIVGESHADLFLGLRGDNPWRKIDDGKKRKRVIWAPHFSISESDWLHHDSFLWLHEGMVKLARKYKDSVQIAFKPHPHLYNVLCNHPDWGEQRTDEYYKLWRTMPNTQVETGEFIELFMQSDGMIHDCGSFTGEYMFTRKPVMFMSTHFKDIYDRADDFGQRCLDLHDVGESIQDVEQFIDKVILTECDLKRVQRDSFFNECLLPPNGKSVAENIYDDLVISLGLH